MSLISVIGGSGFIGTYLCQYLLDNGLPFEIIDLVKSQRFPEQTKIGDVRSRDSLRQQISGDIVINLAAVHHDNIHDSSAYYLTNVTGAENLVEICREKGINRIIFTSSVAVYGLTHCITDENGDTHPFNEYGRTKLAAEIIFKRWQEDCGSSLTIVRPTVVFGEGNRGNFYNLLERIASGRFAMIGSGKNKKSLAYVHNFAAFLVACVGERPTSCVYNYVDYPNMTTTELVLLARKMLGCESHKLLSVPFSVGLALGYAFDAFSKITRRSFPISAMRIRKFCSPSEFVATSGPVGFKPPFSLVEGIERTICWEFKNTSRKMEIFYSE